MKITKMPSVHHQVLYHRKSFHEAIQRLRYAHAIYIYDARILPAKYAANI